MLHIFDLLFGSTCTNFDSCNEPSLCYFCCCYNLKRFLSLSFSFTFLHVSQTELSDERTESNVKFSEGDRSTLREFGTLLSMTLSLLEAEPRTVSLMIFPIEFISSERKGNTNEKLTYSLSSF